MIGDVDLSVRNRLSISANTIVDNSASGSRLGLKANYVMLAGKPGKTNTPAAGNGRLRAGAGPSLSRSQRLARSRRSA